MDPNLKNSYKINIQKRSLQSIEKISEILRSILSSNNTNPSPQGAFSLISKKSYLKLISENRALFKKLEIAESKLKNLNSINKSTKNIKKLNSEIKRISPLKKAQNVPCGLTLSGISLDSIEEDASPEYKTHQKTSGKSNDNSSKNCVQDSTTEINLKILIQKESDIRNLRHEIDKLSAENSKLRKMVALDCLDASKENEQKSLFQKRKNNLSKENNLQKKQKFLSNLAEHSYKGRKKSNVMAAKTKFSKSIKCERQKKTLEISHSKRKCGIQNEIKEINPKRLSKITKTLNPNESNAYSPKRLYNPKARNRAGIERSLSEPREKTPLKLYRTPTRDRAKRQLAFGKAFDDTTLNTIKFQKTKNLFGNNLNGGKILNAEKRNKFKSVQSRRLGLKYEDRKNEGKEMFTMTATSQLHEAFLILSNKKEFWQKRVRMMAAMENIIAAGDVKLTNDQIYLLKNALVSQIYDLRSAVVKQACRLLNCVSGKIPEDILKFLAPLLAVLFSRVYNSIRAIREPCVESTRKLIKNLSNAKCIKELLTFSNDPHPEVRRLAIELVGWCVQLATRDASEKVEKYRISIEITLSSLIKDANEEVRRSADEAFEAFRVKWPDHAKKMFETLKLSARRFSKFA